MGARLSRPITPSARRQNPAARIDDAIATTKHPVAPVWLDEKLALLNRSVPVSFVARIVP